MPRDGSGVFSLPAGTLATANTTIESAKYNAFANDMVSQANEARPVSAGGTGASTASGARTNLGLVIGTDVQAQNANLASLSGLTFAANKGLYTTGANTAALFDLTAQARTLLAAADAAAQRNVLGIQNPPTVSGPDCNNAEIGLWSRFTALTANTPGASTSAGVVYTAEWNADTRLQLAVVHFNALSSPTTTNQIWMRTRRSGTWDTWERIGGPPATSDVGAAYAGLAYGGVGSLVFAVMEGGAITAGQTYAGSALRPAGVNSTTTVADNSVASGSGSQVAVGAGALSGTWRALGSVTNSPALTTWSRGTLFLRIS